MRFIILRGAGFVSPRSATRLYGKGLGRPMALNEPGGKKNCPGKLAGAGAEGIGAALLKSS